MGALVIYADLMSPQLRIAYIGSFTQYWYTESHIANTLESLGHIVTRISESPGCWDLLSLLDPSPDLLLWTWGFGRDTQTSHPQIMAVLDAFKSSGIPTVSIHLDKYFGLPREYLVHSHPFFRTQYVFTADGGHQRQFDAAKINHHWLPPAIYAPEAIIGTHRPEFASPITFVGNWWNYPHQSWPHRAALISFLRREFPSRVRFLPEPGQQIRGDLLSDIYASARIVIGDSCTIDGSRYWSDRIPTTLGRAGFLFHPHTPGLDLHYQPSTHLITWQLGDWTTLTSLLNYHLAHPSLCSSIAHAGRDHVLATATYHHRLEELLAIVFS